MFIRKRSDWVHMWAVSVPKVPESPGEVGFSAGKPAGVGGIFPGHDLDGFVIEVGMVASDVPAAIGYV